MPDLRQAGLLLAWLESSQAQGGRYALFELNYILNYISV